MNKLTVTNYNLQKTLLSGQTFSWDFDGEYFHGITQDKYIKLQQIDDQIFWQTYPDKDNFKYLSQYLRLNDDYETILSAINVDPHVNKAIENYKGLRLIKQDFQQTLISFILSQHKNIKAIKKCVDDLRVKYGKKIKVDEKTVYLFPEIEILNSLSEDKLKQSGVGFRAKYLKSAFKLMTEGVFDNIQSDDYQTAKQKLMRIYGVGDKVADCTLVFSLGFDHVTPIDIWAERVVQNLYEQDNIRKYDLFQNFLNDKFKENTAYAGQFLFEYIRNI